MSALNKSERNSSIELLRIIAMLGVIILHYNCETMGGALLYVEKWTVNNYYLLLSENICIGAVNLYILISAFFLCTSNSRKLIKILELILELILFRFAVYFVGILLGNDFRLLDCLSCFLPLSYYVILYSVLYLISPYINIVINQLTTKQLKRMVSICFAIFSIWSFVVDLLCLIGDFNPMSSIGMYGSNAGYTIVNFALMYLAGVVVRKYYENNQIKKARCIIVVFICLILLFMMSVFTDITWNYNNPIIIIMVMALFALFTQINFHSRVVNELAKGCFTCFLIHGVIVSRMSISKVVNCNILVLIVHQLGTAIMLYFLSYCVYKIYNLLSHPVINFLKKYTDRIDIYLL